MAYGNVKWWNDDGGFGFITDTNGVDIFVHESGIQLSTSNSYPRLEEGEEVEFEIVAGLRAPNAANVREPGEPISCLSYSVDSCLTHTTFVKVFRGRSIREIEYRINEFVRGVDIKIVSASMTNKDGEDEYRVSAIVVFESGS